MCAIWELIFPPTLQGIYCSPHFSTYVPLNIFYGEKNDHLDATNGQILFWSGIQGSKLMIYVTESLHVPTYLQNMHQRTVDILSSGSQPDPSPSLCLAPSLLQPDRDLDGSLPALPLPYRLWNWWGSGLSLWLPCSLSPLSVSSSAAPSAQLLVFSFPIYCNNFLSDVSGISSPTEWPTKPSTTSATSLISPLSSLSASTSAVLN